MITILLTKLRHSYACIVIDNRLNGEEIQQELVTDSLLDEFDRDYTMDIFKS